MENEKVIFYVSYFDPGSARLGWEFVPSHVENSVPPLPTRPSMAASSDSSRRRAGPTHFPADSLLHVFSFGDARCLSSARGVCRRWGRLADESSSWSRLCARLWSDKQNHPHEQWVRLPRPKVDADDLIRDELEVLLLLQMFSGGKLRTSSALAMDLLNFIRVMTSHRKAAPISHVLREQQIETENRLREISLTPASSLRSSEFSQLVQTIVSNIRTPREVSAEDRARFEEEGRLLTWRQSYLASLEDSRRTCITYEVRLTLLPAYFTPPRS